VSAAPKWAFRRKVDREIGTGNTLAMVAVAPLRGGLQTAATSSVQMQSAGTCGATRASTLALGKRISWRTIAALGAEKIPLAVVFQTAESQRPLTVKTI